MFYISQIFDRDTSLVLESVEASNVSRGYNVYSSKILTCMLIDLRNTYVDIFDSVDDSVESYRVYDLLKIIDSCKVKIEGLDILYFAANLKNNTASPTNLDSIKKLSIRKSIAVTSRDYTRFIAKNSSGV